MAMNQFRKISRKEDGYVLVVALLVMAILSLLGIAGMNTSIFETQVAGNDWNAKRTFYQADSGISLGSEVLEQNLSCATGFTQKVLESYIAIKTDDLVLYDNHYSSAQEIASEFNTPATKYHAAFPSADDTPPIADVGYLFFDGGTQLLPGGALQMAAGYEGKGKSAAQGGVAKMYDIYSQFLGPKNSESIIAAGWRHLVGSEGVPKYCD